MASFTYEAIDKAGKTKKANVEADSIEKARAILKNEGYSILSIGETSLLNKDISFNIKKKDTLFIFSVTETVGKENVIFKFRKE